jgi:hypothetical protein
MEDVETPVNSPDSGVEARDGRVVEIEFAIGETPDSQPFGTERDRIEGAILARDDERVGLLPCAH